MNHGMRWKMHLKRLKDTEIKTEIEQRDAIEKEKSGNLYGCGTSTNRIRKQATGWNLHCPNLLGLSEGEYAIGGPNFFYTSIDI